VAKPRYTSADLEQFPDDGKRYEIIGGELFVSKQPSWAHQIMCIAIGSYLDTWSAATARGSAAGAPGLIFAEDDDVAPDLVWISNERLRSALGPEGHLHVAPELLVEVLSPGARNARRDREIKLALYSRRGVDEYWIVDWMQRQIEVYRRTGDSLALVFRLGTDNTLESPLLPGFAMPLRDLFARLPPR
jgi:Uma2 family endonuclease